MGGEDETRRIVDPALSFVDARLAKLVLYWREHAKDGGIPDRAARGTFALVGKEFIAYEAFTAPLSNGGAEATMIITAVVRRSRGAGSA